MTNWRVALGLFFFGFGIVSLVLMAEDPTTKPPPVATAAPVMQAEAKVRARLLFETINGSLQVMHRDFFDDDNVFAIPSRSLEDVFIELRNSHGIEVKWLTVNADTLNVDHDAETEFDRAAVKALSAGDAVFEATSEDKYHFAGAIPLSSECLKCHLRRRLSNEPRTSGLTIAIPVIKTIATKGSQTESAITPSQ